MGLNYIAGWTDDAYMGKGMDIMIYLLKPE